MKRLFILTAMLAASAGAATLNPVQLLNPAGSTAGQTIISTGASSAPNWATVSVDTVTGTLPVANGGTGATSAATARTNLGAAATSGTLAQFAATTSAQLAGVLSDETGSGVAVFGTSPTLATPNITGVTNASNASAGSVGEYATANTTGTALTSGANVNCASLSLTAGDWDVQGVISGTVASGTPTTNYMIVSLSNVSATPGALGTRATISSPSSAGQAQELVTPTVRFNSSSSATIYAVAQVNFSGGTMTCAGFLRARRVR